MTALLRELCNFSPTKYSRLLLITLYFALNCSYRKYLHSSVVCPEQTLVKRGLITSSTFPQNMGQAEVKEVLSAQIY